MKSACLLALAIMPSFAFAQVQQVQHMDIAELWTGLSRTLTAKQVQQVQHMDIAELMMKKYQINVDNTDFTIFYRFSTTGEGESSEEDMQAQVMSVDLNKERKSLVFSVDDINQDDLMSVRFSEELVSAVDKRLVLLIDGQEKGYESNTQDGKRTMIFVLPADSKQVEIIGTKVIPEFQSGLFALIAMMPLVLPVPIFIKHSKRS